MVDKKSLEVLAQMAINSEYFMQVTLDREGKVLSSDSGIGPVPSLFDTHTQAIYFSDCFTASDWGKYENNRLKAWNNHQQSFMVHLRKINYSSGTSIPTKWEFYFISEDFGTCLGIGHPLESKKPYDIGLGEILEQGDNSNELLESLLDHKLIGFWDFDPFGKKNSMSPSLAQALGYSEKEADSTGEISWQKHIHPEDYHLLTVDMVRHFKNSPNLPFKREFRMITKQQQTIWVIGFGKTITATSEGKPLRVLGLVIDISERKKQELWLKEHHFFLKELAFKQSHTLRARVANILGLLEVLDIEAQSVESKRIVTIIKNETKELDLALKKSIKESVQHHQSLEKESDLDPGSHSLSVNDS
ncbi:PAS domain-containing protein [Algoriphagus sp.]|uniref:PAS domain-containing protein n=1 Tax=Algoriphagus sp. TaxID=1872435 RepID=UPI00260B0B93|nr:PAS domain-containing protein [Algoriphagus sp.]